MIKIPSEIFNQVMDVASVICMGQIPDERHRGNVNSGRQWFIGGQKVDLYPMVNDYWAFISDEGVWFKHRYNQEFGAAIEEIIYQRFKHEGVER